MTLPPWPNFQIAIITASLCLAGVHAGAQAPQQGSALQRGSMAYARAQAAMPVQSSPPLGSSVLGSTASAKPSAGVPLASASSPASTARHSMLDEPATPAQIQLSGDRLSISATNASLSEVIRQVAIQTGMQVEGNSRDERVFGVYGPGSPPEVLSALLYDSGYNVVMVGSTTDGAPRRLVLSTRSTVSAAAAGAAAPARSSDEDDDEPVAEMPPPPPPLNPIMQPAPGGTTPPGQPKTPQQMLEELQRMHQGQQTPPDAPHDPQ